MQRARRGILYLAIIVCATWLYTGCGGGSTTTGGGNNNGGANNNGGGNNGGVTGTAPGNVAATTNQVRSLDLQWTNLPTYSATGIHVYTGSTLVATLPPTTTSYQITGLLPDQSYTVRVAAFNAVGENTGASTSATTLHSQPATWTTCQIHAFSNVGDGAAGTYWMRSSSQDNASMVISSPLNLTRTTGDVKNGDSFYVGSRQKWQMWILETTHFNAGKMEDPETFTYDQTGSASVRLYNPDGSVKKNITSGRAILIIKYSAGQYLMSAQYQPTTPDAALPPGTWLCQDVPLTATKTVIAYK